MKTLKYAVTGLLVLVLSSIGQSAKAVPITEIGIPMLGATYNSADYTFTISGLRDVEVFYGGSDSVTYEGTFFALDTSNMVAELSTGGTTITYTADSAGSIGLKDWDTGSEFLIGDLMSLEMTIVDPVLGLFEGSGTFWVTSGSLAGDFGDSGGLATAGISFQVPSDFNDSFAAMANTSLTPSIPDATPLVLLGSAIFLSAVFSRKRVS